MSKLYTDNYKDGTETVSLIFVSHPHEMSKPYTSVVKFHLYGLYKCY